MKKDKRNEIKFVLNKISTENFIYFLKANSGFFSEEFSDRYVNNIYFDNLNFDYYKKNIEGTSLRQKIRLRYYGLSKSNLIKNSILEFKIKENNLGYKIRKKMNDFNINKIFSLSFDKNIKDLTSHLSDNLKPILINNYFRKYFISKSKNIRITIDQFLNYDYLNFNKKINFNRLYDPNIIIEAKFDPRDSDEASMLINQMPLRAIKNSKYVIGINKFLR